MDVWEDFTDDGEGCRDFDYWIRNMLNVFIDGRIEELFTKKRLLGYGVFKGDKKCVSRIDIDY